MNQYKILTSDLLIEFLKQQTTLLTHENISVEEIGDGNVNAVFRVITPNERWIIKQALPYVRIVGEDWPLSLDRNRIEVETISLHATWCPGLVPNVILRNSNLALFIMEDLYQYKIYRHDQMAGKIFRHFAELISDYMAKTLFYSSDFHQNQQVKKQFVKDFINPELCEISEELFFTDPYCSHPRNQIIKPLIPFIKKNLWQNTSLKAKVAKLKQTFLTSAEALLHGDLHTGSIFINEKNLKVIDQEFAFYGPIGFDVGSLLGNFYLNYCYHSINQNTDYQSHLLNECQKIWHLFATKFKSLCLTKTNDPALNVEAFIDSYIAQIFQDALGFAGTEMIRRTIGLALNAEISTISNDETRTEISKKIIHHAIHLITESKNYYNIDQVNHFIQSNNELATCYDKA